ncbi:M3 family metallopeptidase [Bacteroidales bacterium OttesenSCG-928-K03]|nr:M3 family metallopeptidase [Bacteroidales bacterium OttesenSCG-928-L14]MDL2240263.1 M3 family metallopeptidase [Bacteroidales bacterium OttesenSCG-928-K22]MDL2242785.1 M3 family metallopeptidase [Bacteroidales bacterium OttesenSCG-928-K03]
MKKLFFLMTILIITACGTQNNNPLMKPFDTPFQTPPYDLIKAEHFIPAFEAAIETHNKEIAKIINNKETPSFENTILAYDKAGEDLSRVMSTFSHINGNNTNDELQAIDEYMTPIRSKHSDEIAMNNELFQKIKQVFETRLEQNLDPSQIRVVEKYYEDFVRRGADLDWNQKQQLKEINSKLSSLYLQFNKNLLAETNDTKIYVDEESKLAGLPDYAIEAAALAAKKDGNEGKWMFTTKNPSMLPVLQYAENRRLRYEVLSAYYMRCNNNNEFDNKKIVEEITNLRLKKANLLGFETFADYKIAVNMAKNSETVYEFIMDIWEHSLNKAKEELKELQAIADKEEWEVEITFWDWWYYAEKVRKEKYDLDQNEIKPYFSVDNVRDGMFYLSNKLYGITFHKLDNIQTYLPEVEVFEAREANGDHIGVLYLDYFPRAGKRQGAWCSAMRSGGYDSKGNRVYPLVTISCNFTPPGQDTPALLTFDETETLFHEFGHALHRLFQFGKYSRTTGSMPRDMVELPSQIMENWCSEPEMLKVYARHYKTGEVIPDELIEKLNNSSTFNSGFALTERLAATILDLDYQSIKEELSVNAERFEINSMTRIGLIHQILPRYRSTYFRHVFASDGYSAGYYVYTWAEILDKDAFNAYKESGDIYNKELAAKFRKYILTEIGEDEPLTQYIRFRGTPPSNEPFMKSMGYID